MSEKKECPFACTRCAETEQDCSTCPECGRMWLAENYSREGRAAEGFTDTERLEVLMQHPEKLFIDGSGPARMYSGVEKDGAWGDGLWHYDPRDAVDDLVRRVRRAGAGSGGLTVSPESSLQPVT